MINPLRNLLNCYLARVEKGQDLAEYALLIGLMALATIIAVSLISGQLIVVLQTVADYLASVQIG